MAGIQSAIEAAKAVTDKPSIIKVSTIIGFGSAKEGTHGVHGAPLGDDDVAAVKTKFGLDPAAKYSVDADVAALYKEGAARAAAAEAAWNKLYSGYKAAHPAEAAEYERRFAGKLPAGWEKGLVKFSPTDKAIATRSTSGTVLNGVAELVPELLGGSADLSPSNKTELKCSFDYQKDTPAGRYLRFGVREHGMAAVCNGIAAYGGLIPYCATFLNFCGYALGAVRLSALSHFRVLYVFTHDSIALGEDGPTHQPIEMLASLRSMPNMTVYRPADGNETAGVCVCLLCCCHGLVPYYAHLRFTQVPTSTHWRTQQAPRCWPCRARTCPSWPSRHWRTHSWAATWPTRTPPPPAPAQPLSSWSPLAARWPCALRQPTP